MTAAKHQNDLKAMRLALALARRGYGTTSPNPMVGAVLVKGGKIIGRGWHRRAGGPHAEIEALRDAQKRGHNPKGTTLFVTLEPCCTHGRTPPCTEAIIAAGIKRVVVGVTDPNPKHSGKAFKILKHAGIVVARWGEANDEPPVGSRGRSPHQKLASECARLNEAFNHWIVQRTPFVTVKAAMTLDGKIAAASGESKWITGEEARAYGMKLRRGNDAILAGINTILADDPSLTVRIGAPNSGSARADLEIGAPQLRRIVLDSMARTPLNAKAVSDRHAALTTIVAGKLASLLVEGGGEVNASFLLGGLAHRVAFFYAPKILGGRDSRKAVAGEGVKSLSEVIQLRDVEWRKLGADLLLTARVVA
jgi:diaminohydroxyphosphoribosylaminopyrimidine deaminase/5-amino-6-(5-phosphoribosylamino)uracil reductase